ncbi:MAG: NADH-quinone oxidoreductase subunit J [Isosphaeraceae bacterium]
MSQLLFLIISALGLAAALGTVLSRNLVHAALFLVGFFFVVSCQFVLLEAEFLAAVQVLIYIGAVAILMMFGIMLTRNIQGDDTTSVNPAWVWPAMVATLALFAVLIVGINNHAGLKGRSDWAATSRRPSAMSPPRSVAVNDMGRQVGVEMLTRYALPFEVAGLLLTAALVGAIALAHRDPEDSADEPGQRTAHDGHADPMSGSPASTMPVEPLIGAGTG